MKGVIETYGARGTVEMYSLILPILVEFIHRKKQAVAAKKNGA